MGAFGWEGLTYVRLEQVDAVCWDGKRPDVRVGSCFRRALSGHRRERVGTVRVGAAAGPTFASALVVDGRYLCSEHRRERVDTVRAGAANDPTFAAALVVGGRYLCAHVVCELG